MNVRYRLGLLGLVCGGLCLASILVQVSFGTYDMSVTRAWWALVDPRVWGQPSQLWAIVTNGNTTELSTAALIVWTIRLPRVLSAMVVGAALGVSGTVFQSLTRNELASPYILGVSAGAGLSVLLVLVFLTALRPFLPLVAAIGGGLAFLGVYLVAWKGGTSPVRLVLAGVVMTTILDSLQMALYLLVDDVGMVHSAMAWIIGSLVGVDWEILNQSLPWIVVAMVALIASSRHLDVISLGDRTASSVGMSVETIRFGFATGAVLLASTSVTVAGTIGFVGLIMPHVARNLVGGNNRQVMMASAVSGAALLALADVLSRLVFSPTQIPVGIVTGLVGGSYFLVLMRRQSIAGVGTSNAGEPASRGETSAGSKPREEDSDGSEDGLSVKNIELGYGDDPSVIRGVSCRIPNDQITVLVGPNGSGKSTLIRGIGRQLSPRDGSVHLDGESVFDMARKPFARSIAMLQQEHQPMMDVTVEELTMHGRYPYRPFFGSPEPSDEQAVERALKLTGMEERRRWPVDELSGGQKQLTWLAMCLAQESRVLLLDEPTTFLDVSHQYQLLELLKRLTTEQSKTILLVLHDLEQAVRFADRLLVMDDGTIHARGEPGETLTPEVLSKIFGIVGTVENPSSGGTFLKVEKALKERTV